MLPPYTVRRSQRTKHPRIVINSKGGIPKLEVVLPKRFDEAGIPSFVNQHKEWIARNWEKQTQYAKEAQRGRVLPSEIVLAALGETWKLAREPSLVASRLVWENMVLKTCPETDDVSVVLLLKKWLSRKAKFHLVPQISELAKTFGFNELRDVGVRCQKTLWGSCNRKGAVSLNSKLLFLPPHLVRHILLHELCHLRVMNHSSRFYELLNSLDIETKKNSALVRNQWDYVPRWIELA